jgi:hypothetical protein
MSWKGSTGQLVWYNKEKQENIPVKLPFEFLVLDQLATITGYSKPAKSGFWSNEVRNTRKEELVVKSKQGTVYSGMYKNEQDIVMMPKGAEYAQSVYIAHKIGDKWVIGNIKMSGSARSAWFDFKNSHIPENGKVIIDKGEVQTAQTGDFYPPEFKYEHSTPEEDGIAITLDKTLQIYLNQYLATSKEENQNTWPSDNDDSTDDIGKATPEQIADYEARKTNVDKAVDSVDKSETKEPARQWNNVGKKHDEDEDAEAVEKYKQSFEEEPINLDDIPF